ncbi:hypothetical protein ABZP36_003780 [Zizania latifolia]
MKLAHTYKVLIHVDTVEDYSQAACYGHPRVRTFEWRLGVPDGEDVQAPYLDDRRCNQQSFCHRNHDDDEGEDRDLEPPRRRHAKSIWACIGCRDEGDVLSPSSGGRSTSKAPGSHRQCAILEDSSSAAKVCSPEGPASSSLQVLIDPLDIAFCSSSHDDSLQSGFDPMCFKAASSFDSTHSIVHQVACSPRQVTPVELEGHADDFHARLDEFLASMSLALPQPILKSLPKVQKARKQKEIATASRRSSRLAVKNPEGRGPSALASRVLARK